MGMRSHGESDADQNHIHNFKDRDNFISSPKTWFLLE